jgi:hypothetical protein
MEISLANQMFEGNARRRVGATKALERQPQYLCAEMQGEI